MFRCMEYTFTFTIFEQFACACPEKQSCPDIFHCIWTCIFCHSGFLSNLHALALKNRVAQKFFAVWNILFTFQIWATCACPEKQRVPWIYCTEYIFFIIQEFWVTCACPEKQSCPDIFHCIEYTLYIQEFWATCTYPEKQSCPEIFRCVKYSFYIQNFWATCACPEKQSCPDIFHYIEHVFFIIQEFWVTCACPEKQRVPWNFSLYGIYFLHSEVLSNLHALALKNRGCPDIFHCIEHVFFINQDFWATCACPEKQSCPEIFCCMEYTIYLQNFWTTCACPEKQRVPWYFSLHWTCIFYQSGFLSN